MVIDSNFFMGLALKEAWKYQGLTYPNPAVGCTIVGENNEILAVEAHHKAGEAHAEVNALKSAYMKLCDDTSILQCTSSSDIHAYLLKNHNNIFQKTVLYTTLEPCSHLGKTPSCASLIVQLGIKEVYVGSLDMNEEAHKGNRILEKYHCSIATGVMQDACDLLLSPFNLWREKNFIFFKWAQRFNGTTDGSEISSLKSRKNVHAMRDVCDLLVIGGNTVRIDKPTLDARLVNGKAPDILILSRSREFDKDIPLFKVKNRKIFIENNFSKLDEYKNIMIEGTSSMYALSREYVDLYLSYTAPKFGGTKNMNKTDDTFEILNMSLDTTDIKMWLKKEV